MQVDAAYEDCSEVAQETESCVKQALCIQHLRKDDVAEDVMDLRDCAVEADRAGVSTAASGSTRSPRTPMTFGGRTSSASSAGFGPLFLDSDGEAGHSIEIQPWRQPGSEMDCVLRGLGAEEVSQSDSDLFGYPGRAGSMVESLGAIPEDQEGDSEATATASAGPVMLRIPLYTADSSSTPAITFDWLLQLSRRSGVSCMDSARTLPDETQVASARSVVQANMQAPSSRAASAAAEAVSEAGTVQWHEDSPLFTAEADSVRSFGSLASGSDHHSLASYSDHTGLVHEEVVSVVDVADEHMVDSAPSMGTASLNVVDGTITDSSPNSSVFASPRPQDSVGSLLQRLAFENQLLDESVESSVRRVLDMQMVHAQDPEGPRLSEAEIRELPQVPYCSTGLQQQCAICLEMFQEGEMLTLLRCEHCFHVDCVASWMQRAIQCPLCRTCVAEDRASGTAESEV
eukprot:TRINITY_DN32655_c0_g1_i1.p1 TRINITY_DN32655_c0_g1~~TRINITY_DN32655_c0_g1_i1.p1  ORF type:complete len:458 (+),score=70.35 TRINITY_DN32655_c0_g1_i1:67-1440(+)